MHDSASLRPRLVEALYGEALMLADEVRAGFDLSELEATPGRPQDPFRVALSCEALRATTRMMHAVAWLLNRRAYLRGELSLHQLRNTGALSHLPGRDAERVALLPLHLRQLVETSEAFYRRLLRFERDWNSEGEPGVPTVSAMQERLEQVFAQAS